MTSEKMPDERALLRRAHHFCRSIALDAVARNVFGYMISQILLLGYLRAIFDGEKQAWHEKLAGTVVIDERANAIIGVD